jgi:3-phenylpropionate/trans-cinnamate dioxygenase ferredoxin reductase subunit
MGKYTYLIIGGGMTAHAAVRGVRDVDRSGSMAVFSSETDPPYKRPPLTKGLWTGKSFDSIWYNTADLGVELHLGRPLARINPGNRTVAEADGVEHTYDKLLLATGARPRELPFGEGVNYYRTVADYRRLRDDADRFERFAVIGGGFIGSEIAAALAMNGRRVTMVFPDDGMSSRIFPADLAHNVGEYYREKGLELMPGCSVARIEPRDGGYEVSVGNEGEGRKIAVDRVVAGIGVEPNVELATEAGIDAENGIIVDEYVRTSAPDVFAAGDVAAFVNPALGSRMRVEHEDNAKAMGRTAGRNLAGATEKYEHLPFFYSDLFDLGYEAVGELDSRLETVADWKEPYREGVVYYLRDGRVRGVLLWNVWKQVDAARRLIAEPGPFSAADLRGRLPEGSP